MKPLKSQPLEDQKEKMQFVFEQAEKALDTSVSAYDSLATKAFTLFSVEAGILSLLVGYVFVQNPPPVYLWPAVVFAGFLAASEWYCWRVMGGKDFFHVGRTPNSFGAAELSEPLPEILNRQCIKHQERTVSNRKKVSDAGDWLQAAMLLFLLGAGLALVLSLVVATTQNVVVGVGRHGAVFVEGSASRGWRRFGGRHGHR